MAGCLINDSFSEWLDSPIGTTISTHPIGSLDFPTVTVCPPKGSITALNYDLMKADNNFLTVKDRDVSKNAVYSTITKPSHDQFMRNMLATINKINLRQVY